MAFNFHLPDIGEGVVEGEIVSWKVAEGDDVELDQPMVEVMTDKATVEIPAPRSGKISKINFAEGEICPVGDILVVIDDGAGAPAEAPRTEKAPAEAPRKTVQPPQVAQSGGQRNGNGAHGATVVPKPSGLPQVVDATTASGRIKATPATRRVARQLGVDLRQVPATGKNGRVTTDDVRGFAEGGPATPAQPAQARGPSFPPVSIPRTELEERVPFRGMRKRIADNMVRSAFTATHFTYVEEVDMTELVTVRERAKARAAERGIKLTYLPFIVKAIVSGLKKWPALNASLDESTNEIVRKKYYHIGIASQGPQGLLVTVLRDADRRSIFEISQEIQRLADDVQKGTISREDLTGSTFTISSLGKLGGVMATPIINFPEVGIVGVHQMAEKPAVRDGKLCIRWLMNLSISLDHRLVDGWDGAMFLQDVKALLEDPTTMFMEMV